MNASKAKRRWLKWCRYVAGTGTVARGSSLWITEVHRGHAKAYEAVMFAGRSYPRGARAVWYPRWAHGSSPVASPYEVWPTERPDCPPYCPCRGLDG